MAATGRADLSQELGFPGQKTPGCAGGRGIYHKKGPGTWKTSHNRRRTAGRVGQLYEMGVRCFLVGKDEALLAKKAAENLENVKNFHLNKG